MDELTCKRVKGTWNSRKGSCELGVPGWTPTDDLLSADIHDAFENEKGDQIIVQGTDRGWEVNLITHDSTTRTPIYARGVDTEEKAFSHAIDLMKKYKNGI